MKHLQDYTGARVRLSDFRISHHMKRRDRGDMTRAFIGGPLSHETRGTSARMSAILPFEVS